METQTLQSLKYKAEGLSLFPASRLTQGPSKQLYKVKCVLPLILKILDINLTITLM
jgi:hypothetical protein